MSLEEAIKDLRAGKFILVHDFAERENEVDLVVLAEKVKPEQIMQMRRDGGGLICTAVHPTIAENFGLPYLTEIFEAVRQEFKILGLSKADDIPYDERSSFSISVNHRKTFTGITDRDRALTIGELGRLGGRALREPVMDDFGR
ncbi:MAG: 3,4-dihydroxy-2-butanone-4-phosphate synthase, partial [Candidatus Hadarchaeales archaeon]